MKRLLALLMAALLGGVLVMGCATEDEGEGDKNPTGTGTPTDAPGLWEFQMMPFGTLIKDTIVISIDLGADSVYDILVQELGDDTLFYSTGSFRIAAGKLTMTGTQCGQIDTTADPDTVVALPDTICSVPVTVDAPTVTPWPIKIGDLGQVLDVFPIPSDMKAMLGSITLNLDKR